MRELKNHLSQYLARVKRGERITVTERGKEIAVIKPAVEEDHLRSRLMQLVAEDRATRDGDKPSGLPEPVPIKGKPISETIIEDRGEVEAVSRSHSKSSAEEDIQ